MTEQEYDKAVGDLVNYLQWMGEPAQDKRKTLGMWVLAYLAIFIFGCLALECSVLERRQISFVMFAIRQPPGRLLCKVGTWSVPLF